jgi:hypothetical protein
MTASVREWMQSGRQMHKVPQFNVIATRLA